MVSVPKVVGVLSCSVVLCLSLSNATQAADDALVTERMKSDPADRTTAQRELSNCDRAAQGDTDTIKGELLRIQGDNYVVQRFNGQEVRLHTDANTQKTVGIRRGDRIEAEVSDVRDVNDDKCVRSIRRIE